MKNFLKALFVGLLALEGGATQIPFSEHVTTFAQGTKSAYGQAVAITANRLLVVGDPNFGSQGPGRVDLVDLDRLESVGRLMAPNATVDDTFGSALATDGPYVVVGAPRADSAGASSGAAYVFNTVTMSFLFELQSNDLQAGDRLGGSVAIAGDLIVVGAGGDDDNGSTSGSAYVFDATSGQQLLKLLPEDGSNSDTFGGSAVSIQAGLVAVGSVGHEDRRGAVYLFDVNTGEQIQKLLAEDGESNDRFGRALILTEDSVIVGAPAASDFGLFHSGAVYVFDLASGRQRTKFIASAVQDQLEFGTSLSLSGATLAVGAPGANLNLYFPGSAYLFDLNTGLEMAQYMNTSLPALETEFRHAGASLVLTEEFFVAGAPGDPGTFPAPTAVFFLPRVELPAHYCAATQSSSGCSATISFSSQTSLPISDAGDAILEAQGLEGGRNGLLFCSSVGAAQLPFMGGTLCVEPPLKRSPMQFSLGVAGQCDGSFSTVINDGLAPPIGLDPGPGNTGWYQYWYRDPNSPDGGASTDAIEVDFR